MTTDDAQVMLGTRLLAAELGGHGIRGNGINPDGVVRGSGAGSP